MDGKSMALGLAERGAFSPDGKRLAVTGYGPRIRVIDLERRRDVWRRGIVSHPRALLWTASGNTLYVVGTGGRVVVMDPASGEIQRRFEHPTEDVDAEWALTADGYLAHASFGQALEILDPDAGCVVKTWPASGRRLTKGLLVLPGGSGLTVFTDTPPKDDRSPVGPTHLHIWNPQIEPEPSRTVRFTSGMFMPGVAASPDGSTIALFDDRRRDSTELVLVDVEKGVAHPGPELDVVQKLGSRAGWSPDGQHVALLLDESVAVLETGRWQTTQRLRAEHPQDVAWSPDGKWLFVGGSTAYLVDAAGERVDPPSAPQWKEEDGLFALMDLDARGEIDADSMLSYVETALLDRVGTPEDVDRMPAAVRAVLLSSYWESSVTWEGTTTAAENLRPYLRGVADAYRMLGLDGVATVLEKLSASTTKLPIREEREGSVPISAPVEHMVAELEAAGLARAAGGRIELIRQHRADFAHMK